ncbi:MAG: Si-specific NAD(P)(+) transhydrogenase [Gaiella sp.]
MARTYDYDLLAIGSGPAGQKAAIQAAKLGARAAVIDRAGMLGGVCTNTGTIPSKSLREAILRHTSGRMHGASMPEHGDETSTMADLFSRSRIVIAKEVDVIRNQLARNGVAFFRGNAVFEDPHTVLITGEDIERRVTASHIVIAVGTHPANPRGIELDGRTVVDSDGLLHLTRLPRSLVVVGAGVIGIEYTSMFAAMGVRVTVVEQRTQLLEFCDQQISEALKVHLQDENVTFRLGEQVTSVATHGGEAVTELASGKRILSEAVLCSAGRVGATDTLGLDKAGLEADERGRLSVSKDFRTHVRHIFAVGDVIGFPSLAATSMEQGRLAACAALGASPELAAAELPIGVYTIPEISFVGRTEEDLTSASIPYETGISRYRELARGAILGDTHGLLKLLVCSSSRRLLGVHAFGTGATELIHVGQAVMALGGTVDYLVGTVFNFPTLAEAYKVAALDATNKLRAISRLAA